MTRHLLGYVVKLSDGTRFSGTPKPVSRDEAESFGNNVEGWVVPVFSKPKPAPAAPAAPVAPVAPVVAAEGRYAVITEEGGDAYFQDINDGSDGWPRDDQRAVGSREMAVAFLGRWPSSNRLVRILADGEHEAAVEAARREERERVLEVVRDVLSTTGLGLECGGRQDILDRVIRAAKGQAK